MPSWPSTLPQDLSREGYEEGLGDNVVKSKNDAGPPKRRQRYTGAEDPLVGTMLMTSAQIEIFKSFINDDISYGADAFDFPALLGATGTIPVAFKTLPKWTNVRGDLYRVSLDFLIQPTGSTVVAPLTPDPNLPGSTLNWSARLSSSAITHADWHGTYIFVDASGLSTSLRQFTYNNITYQTNNFVLGERLVRLEYLDICSQTQRVGTSDYAFDDTALSNLAMRARLVNGTETSWRTASGRYDQPGRISNGFYYCLVGAEGISFLEQWRLLGEDNDIIIELMSV